MNTSRTEQRSTQRGMALAVALLALLILTVLGLALGSMGIENLNQIRAAGDTAALVHAANGGLHELMNRIYGNGDTTNGVYGRGVTDNRADVTGTYTTSLAACHYWWTFNTTSGEPYCTNNLEGSGAVTGWNGMRVPARTALLVTSADVVPRAESQHPVLIVALVNNGFPYAISSDGMIDANNVTSLLPGQANIRSNSTSGTSSNPNVEVASVDGTVFSRNGSGTIKVTGASGPQLFDQDPITIPNIPITTVVQSQSTAGIGGAHPYGGPAAIQIPSSGPAHSMSNSADGTELLIDGVVLSPRPVSVYVDGDVRATGGGSIALPQGVHLFVRGSVDVSGSLNQLTTPAPTGTSTSGLPADKNFLFCTGSLTFNGAEGQSINMLVGGSMLQRGTSHFSGLLYSQNGDVQFNGGGTLTGSIIAREGVSTRGGNTVAKNLDVIFNPEVLNTVSWLGFGILGPVHTTSWWVVIP
jgi:hypothetical protein